MTRVNKIPSRLAHSTLPDLRGTPWRIAVLPWGATEPHNYHLPYGTDSIQAEAVAVESVRLACEEGAAATVLPTIPMGANAQQMGEPLTLNLDPSTQATILEDVALSLEQHGIPALVVLNGHGGNDFRQMIRELQARTDVFLCAVNWYTVVPPADYFDEPGDHAGELETSVMMHLRPDLVRPLEEAGPGAAKSFRIRALREGWAWAPRDWKQVTADTGVGNPSAASADKGERYFQAATRRIADFLVELAAADLDDLYE